MNAIRKFFPPLAVVMSVVSAALMQVSPVAAESVASQARVSTDVFPMIEAPLPVEILTVVVCLIFLVIAVFPMFTEKRPTQRQ